MRESLYTIIYYWVKQTRPKYAGWHSTRADIEELSGSLSYGLGATDWPGHGYMYIDPDSVTVYRRIVFAGSGTHTYERQDKILAADPSFFELLSEQMDLIERDIPVVSNEHSKI